MNRFARSLALVVLPLSLAVGVAAQDKDKTKKSGHERLQPYWNQLELTEKQRVEYDRVVREYKPRIDKLEDELEALKEKRRKDWQAILTAAQKRQLESIMATRGKNKKDEDKDDKEDKTVKDEEETKTTKKTTRKPPEEETEEKKTTTKKKTTKKDTP